MMYRTLTISATLLSLLWSSCAPAYADDDDDRVGMDEVMNAVRSGASLSLSEIRLRVADRISGEIVRVGVKRKHGILLYEVRVLKTDGKLVEAEVDAASGRILEIENE
jgi:uncharacterized membrane protein YkoI